MFVLLQAKSDKNSSLLVKVSHRLSNGNQLALNNQKSVELLPTANCHTVGKLADVFVYRDLQYENTSDFVV